MAFAAAEAFIVHTRAINHLRDLSLGHIYTESEIKIQIPS